MVGELIPAPVDPRTAGEAFWKRYHEMRRLWHKELRPEDPIEPDEVAERLMRRGDPYRITHYYEVVRDGVMVAWFDGETVSPRSPEYETNKQFYEGWAFTRPDHRRAGIAKGLLPLLVELAGRQGCTVVNFYVEEEGQGFMRWLGAEPKLTEIESRLDVDQLDWSMVEQWAAEGPVRSPQTSLEIYDGEMPDEMLEDFTRQFTELDNMVPWEELAHGDEIMTPEILRDWYERQAIKGARLHTVIAREPDGVISGLTDVTWAPHAPGIVHQQLTAVRPAARGRGLGKWIKAAMLLHLRKLYPDMRWIVTENAGSNAPMLNINRTLGFKPYRTGTEYQIDREKLEERIRQL